VRIEKLNILLENELIDKETYDAIIELRYEEVDEDVKMKQEYDKDYSCDDITKFDKEKENMGIAKIKFQSFSDSKTKNVNW